MFLYYAPLHSLTFTSCATFLAATQMIAMSSQAYNQVAEARYD